jgi:hypothetical protein
VSTLSTSVRTLVVNTVLSILESRKDKSVSRVSSFDLSKKYLTTDQTKTRNTYCVLVSEESPQGFTQVQRDWKLELKIVCYAHHADEPHPILDAMIEDLQEAMSLLLRHADVSGKIWNLLPASITSDERTTEAGPWAQAVCTWTLDHGRA